MHLDAQQRVERAAPATLNRRLVALNRFFQSTMARHLLLANPTHDNSAHTLRQTFAARYLAANPDDLRGLARLLGHASLNTVMIYTEPSPSDLAQRMEQVKAWVDPDGNEGNQRHER